MLGVVARPSRRVVSGREALPVDRELSGGPHKGSGVVGRPFRRAGSDQHALTEGRKDLPDDWEWSEALAEGRVSS